MRQPSRVPDERRTCPLSRDHAAPYNLTEPIAIADLSPPWIGRPSFSRTPPASPRTLVRGCWASWIGDGATQSSAARSARSSS